jgi:molecular chaperone DnaK (HSP70)
MNIFAALVPGVAVLAMAAYYFGWRGREVIVGVDLGTSYTVVAVKMNGKLDVILNEAGRPLIPSVVSFTSGRVKVGDTVGQGESATVLYHAKRFIGRKFLDEDASLAEDIQTHPFKVEADTNGFAVFSVPGYGRVSPVEVGKFIMTAMLEAIKRQLGFRVNSVVVCVPVSFRNLEREHTRKVFTELGLTVTRLVEEPVAAAVAYDIHKITSGNRRVVVFDLGGGTFDVTTLWVAKSGSITVLGTTGDSHLGGQDFDQAILGLLRQKCPDMTVDLAEQVKIALTTQKVVKSMKTASGCNLEISETQFQEISRDLLQRIAREIVQALENQMMDKKDIDDVVLVGGGSRMPIVRNLLKTFFFDTHAQFHDSLDPDTVVALGAANILD